MTYCVNRTTSAPITGRNGLHQYMNAHPQALLLLQYIYKTHPSDEWTLNELINTPKFPEDKILRPFQTICALVNRGALIITGKLYSSYQYHRRNTYQITQTGKSIVFRFNHEPLQTTQKEIELRDVVSIRELTPNQIKEVLDIAETIYNQAGLVRPKDIAYTFGWNPKQAKIVEKYARTPYIWISQILIHHGGYCRSSPIRSYGRTEFVHAEVVANE